MVVVGVGAIPVLAEVDETLTLDPVDFEKKITKYTKAVIPVHIQGFPCDMDAIMEIAKKHNIAVIEDACQADGGSYKGKRLGTIGDAGALSFNYFKIISCGEGGALLTNDKKVFERALIYHDSSAVAYFGDQLSNVEQNLFCGSEYRTNEISSAILRKQIEKLDGILYDLRNYKRRLMKDLDGLYNFIKSNDIEGDCGTTLAIRFNSYEEGKVFAEKEGVNGWTPVETGKHVYKNWTPIMNKVGAYNPLFDPFKMEANKDIIPDYKEDSCPVTLDHLAKTVYVAINPNWTEEEYQAVLTALKNAK
jgi:dTDP-4-amino-4,6-dideoxygalactose transaminase